MARHAETLLNTFPFPFPVARRPDKNVKAGLFPNWWRGPDTALDDTLGRSRHRSCPRPRALMSQFTWSYL